MKPVNTEALSKWVGNVPPDVMSEMADIAPMLARLGYSPHDNPPDYTRPEPKESLYNYSQVRLKRNGEECRIQFSEQLPRFIFRKVGSNQALSVQGQFTKS